MVSRLYDLIGSLVAGQRSMTQSEEAVILGDSEDVDAIPFYPEDLELIWRKYPEGVSFTPLLFGSSPVVQMRIVGRIMPQDILGRTVASDDIAVIVLNSRYFANPRILLSTLEHELFHAEGLDEREVNALEMRNNYFL